MDAGTLATGSLTLDASSETDGSIIVTGGASDNAFYGGMGTNVFDGGAGQDYFVHNGGRSEFHGGTGGDRVLIAEDASIASLTLRGGQDFDTLEVFGLVLFLDMPRFTPGKWGFESLQVARIVGTSGDDYLNFFGLEYSYEPFVVGMDGNDVMIGADGLFNRFYGMAGNDRLYGGNDADEMTGGTGRNRLYGGGGDDYLANYAVLTDGAGRTLLDGGDGNDQIFANNSLYRIDAGSGDDQIALQDTTVRQGSILGGAGLDTLALSSENGTPFGGIVFDVDFFDAETAGLESLTGGEVAGSRRNNALDFSEFTLLTDFGVTVHGNGGNDYLAGTYGDDVLMGGAGDDVLNGTAGRDDLDGGAGNDGLTGSLGQDQMTGRGGADTYVFVAAADSTGVAYDTIEGFNGGEGDTIDLWFDVEVVRESVSAGSLSTASFDTDLAAAIGADQLAGQEAVLFTPDSGSLAGPTFLIVDANNTSGYQPGQDLVIEMTHLTGDLSPADFT